MREAAVVLDRTWKVIRWHAPDGRTAGSVPDDVSLWHTLWEHRADVGCVIHSHPGAGWPTPSHEDVTTFAAVDAALGRRLVWGITTADIADAFVWCGPGPLDYSLVDSLVWYAGPVAAGRVRTAVNKLRELSEYEHERKDP